jgi:hypothetical protein
MKIDVHDIPPALLEQVKGGKVLQGSVQGTGKDGTPGCASVQVDSWRIV